MSAIKKNRFAREVEAVIQDNPNIDMDLIIEWQKIATVLEKIPPSPEMRERKQPWLQPIPLKLFNR